MKSALEFIKESSFKYDTESKQKILLQYFNIENNQLFIEVSNKDLYSTIFLLKTNSEFQFKQLIDIIGVDYPEKTDRFKIIYLLLENFPVQEGLSDPKTSFLYDFLRFSPLVNLCELIKAR